MKGLLVAGSLAAVLMMTGCSQKSTTDADANKAVSADSKVDSVGASGKDNFVDLDAKTAAIRELESQLKSIYFDFDKFNVRGDQEQSLKGDASLLASEKAKALTIKVEGNCDEWGTDEYNYALGLKRAKTVRDALTSQGIDGARMIMVSYGESKPVCNAASKDQNSENKSCWQQNRRVDFKLLP